MTTQPFDEAEIRAALAMSPSELITRAGEELAGEGLGLGPSDAERWRRLAQAWIVENRTALRNAICDSSKVQALISEARGDRALEVAAVADAILTLADKPAALLLSTFFVKEGLSKLCL